MALFLCGYDNANEESSMRCLTGDRPPLSHNFLTLLNFLQFIEFSEFIKFIELTDFIKSDEDYTTCINHFSRRVYVDLAQRVVEIANNVLVEECLRLKR